MALQYRDTRTGKVVDMPEGSEVEQAAEKAAAERAKGASKKAKLEAEYIAEQGVKNAEHARRTLTRMDESDRWERVKPEPKAKPEPTAEAKTGTTKRAAKPATDGE